MADILQHFAQLHELVANDLALFVQGHLQHVAFCHLHVANALEAGGEHGAHLAAQALAQVLQAGADGQAVLGESGLAAAIGQLLEDFAHGHVDGVTYQVGVQALQQSLAGQDFGGHSGGVGHAGAAQGLHQGFLDNAFLHVQGQLARALLGAHQPTPWDRPEISEIW